MQNKSQPTTQTQNQNTPKIRFKNFTDEWVEKKFGEIFKYERPDRFIVKNDEYDEKANTPVLTANKAFILGYTNENNTYNNESIIFDDFTLDCKYVDFPYMVKSSAIKILTIKNKEENNLKFAFESLNSTKFEVMGHARHYIAFIQNTATFVPNLTEQCKISEFFAKLDKLISLNQSKFEKLQKIKKSCLQNLFPQNNQNTPKIRFKNFTDEWVESKLKENCIYKSSNLSNSDIEKEGIYDLYDANGIIGKTKKNPQTLDYITIIKDGSGVGRVRLLPKNTAFIGTMGALQSNNCINFLYVLLQKMDFSLFVNGATIPHIYFSDYGNAINKIPKNSKEQQKIGAFFSKLDKLISLQQRKVEKLKNIKKALLNKMFI